MEYTLSTASLAFVFRHQEAEAASCPDGVCECPSCLVSMLVNNELVFFRKFSDPTSRRENEPRCGIGGVSTLIDTFYRIHYYRIKVLEDKKTNQSIGKTDLDSNLV